MEKKKSYRLILAKYPCPCCGYRTLPEPAGGTYEICPVCYWEDDKVQLAHPDLQGGANDVSLLEAQENFRAFGACSKDALPYVRPPMKHEMRGKDGNGEKK